jgi:serine/threonine protein phosphatase PrpC
MTLALRYAVRSDVGLLREGNEDSAYAGPHLLAVADGMGGYEAGEVASASVISTVAPLDRTAMPESELIDALAAAVNTAKETLRSIVDADPAVGSMGTTLTAMLWSGATAAICHIGDSRAYLLREGDLYQVTHDHTFVQALVDQGRIRPDEAATHPQRSLLLRALDGRTDADPDLSLLTAEVGDRFLLCSDGLPVVVSDDLIVQALAEVPEPSDAVLQLIDLAIRAGGPDNITCIVADVIETGHSLARPTTAPVLAGAAASGGSNDTMPFARPEVDGQTGMTRIGVVPTAVAGPTTPVPGSGSPGRGSTLPGTVPGAAAAGAATTPAAPARPARHTVADDDDAVTEPRGRRRWPVMTTLLVLFILLIGGGLVVGYQVIRSQYFLGTDSGKVVIFRGINDKVLGISLFSAYRRTGIPLSGLPRDDKQVVSRGDSQNLTGAQQSVAAFQKDYTACQDAYAAVRLWEAHKPKPVIKHKLINGKLRTFTVIPQYRPKPTIPAGCPPQSVTGT